MGLKLLAVCGLALLMTIPALFVFFLLADRTSRAEGVVREISQLVGGRQTFLGPVIAIPYSLPAPPVASGQPPAAPATGVHVIYPVTASATAATRSEVRTRSLFSVPVYRADLRFRADFDLTGLPRELPQGATADLNRAELVLGASDARGAQADILVTLPGRKVALAPASSLASGFSLIAPGDDRAAPPGPRELTFFAAPAADLLQAGGRFQALATASFSGAQRLALLPYG